jgi:hypothetical protein
MSIDTTFAPKTQTYAVDNTAAVQLTEAGQVGATTFRVRNINAAAIYFSWGAKSAGLAAAAPAIGAPKANTIGLAIGGIIYIEVPPNSFFIASAVAPALEITGGMGGVGNG